MNLHFPANRLSIKQNFFRGRKAYLRQGRKLKFNRQRELSNSIVKPP